MITADKAYSKETLQLYQTQDPPAKVAQALPATKILFSKAFAKTSEAVGEYQRLAENSQQNRRSKTEDLTIRRLTWGNKAMKAAFESVKQKLTAQS